MILNEHKIKQIRGLLLLNEVEEVTNNELSKDSTTYKSFYEDLSASLQNVILEIEYFKVTKQADIRKIEIAGILQNKIEFIIEYGSENGLFLKADNVAIDDAIIENLKYLYIYYKGQKFIELAKTLLEDN